VGKRITDLRLNGEPLDADKKYKVTGWAPVAEEAKNQGNKMAWDVVEPWLASRGGKVSPRKANAPKIIGALPNPGYIA
jgi:sulfur-oxidizing protein SoxB